MSPSNHADEHWEQLAAAASGILPIAEFEDWLYKGPYLEDLVGKGSYHDLIALNYREPTASGDLETIVRKAFAERRPSGIERDAAVWVARALR